MKKNYRINLSKATKKIFFKSIFFLSFFCLFLILLLKLFSEFEKADSATKAAAILFLATAVAVSVFFRGLFFSNSSEAKKETENEN